jgi:2-(1,2-epoxy-1,2-dihydrophenyl)acetyl-CoA isomerase
VSTEGQTPESGLDIREADGVLEIHITAGSRQNAIDATSAEQMTNLLRDSNLEKDVRAILITGEGRYFCTGAQVAPGATDMSILDYRWATRQFSDLTRALWEVEKPVVSAVNGTVAGAGWMLALLADLVVAANGARWTHVFSRRGMVPHAGDTFYLPRILPFHRLMEIAFLSDTWTSEQLHQIGAVNRLAPEEEVVTVARDLATRLAGGPTRSLGFAKRLYRNSLSIDLDTALREERDATALLSQTHDRVEGMKAWVERRPPQFTGD